MPNTILSLISAAEANLAEYAEAGALKYLIEVKQLLEKLERHYTTNQSAFTDDYINRLKTIRAHLKQAIGSHTDQIENDLLAQKQIYTECSKKIHAYQSLLKEVLALEPGRRTLIANKQIAVRTRVEYQLTQRENPTYIESLKQAIKECDAWDECVDISIKQIRLAINRDKQRMQPVVDKLTRKKVSTFVRLSSN